MMTDYLNVVGAYATAIFVVAIVGRYVRRWFAAREQRSIPFKGSNWVR
jgi:hypothetical protein